VQRLRGEGRKIFANAWRRAGEFCRIGVRVMTLRHSYDRRRSTSRGPNIDSRARERARYCARERDRFLLNVDLDDPAQARTLRKLEADLSSQRPMSVGRGTRK
jgi:hypothetical protein